MQKQMCFETCGSGSRKLARMERPTRSLGTFLGGLGRVWEAPWVAFGASFSVVKRVGHALCKTCKAPCELNRCAHPAETSWVCSGNACDHNAGAPPASPEAPPPRARRRPLHPLSSPFGSVNDRCRKGAGHPKNGRWTPHGNEMQAPDIRTTQPRFHVARLHKWKTHMQKQMCFGTCGS